MLPLGMEIYLAVEPVDMRLGFERLGAMVREKMSREPRSRAMFVFFGRRRHFPFAFCPASTLCHERGLPWWGAR